MVTVTCQYCKMQVNKAKAVKVANRKYCCPEHAEPYRREHPQKPTSQSEIDKSFQLLIEEICRRFAISKPTGLMLRQIKQYRDEYEFTYDGMRATIWYYCEIAHPNQELNVNYGVAMIPYSYEDAKAFYWEQKRLEYEAERADIEAALRHEQTIRINAEDIEDEPIRVRGFIDIAALGGDADQ